MHHLVWTYDAVNNMLGFVEAKAGKHMESGKLFLCYIIYVRKSHILIS